jgi:hypothetical protein
MRALRQAPWQGRFDAIEGIILYESMPELAMAAEQNSSYARENHAPS